MSPKKGPLKKKKIIFQPSSFSGYSFVFREVYPAYVKTTRKKWSNPDENHTPPPPQYQNNAYILGSAQTGHQWRTKVNFQVPY